METAFVGKTFWFKRVDCVYQSCNPMWSRLRLFWSGLQGLVYPITQNKHRCHQNKPQNMQQMSRKNIPRAIANRKSMRRRFRVEGNWKIAWNWRCTRIQGPSERHETKTWQERRRKFSPPGQEVEEKVFHSSCLSDNRPPQQVIVEKNNFHDSQSRFVTRSSRG